jgi:hypothetical protein
MYIRVPAVDGVPQVGDRRVINAISISPSEAICQIDDGETLSDWIELSEEEFNQYMTDYISPSSTELVQPSNTEIHEKQLIIMEAIAEIYETITKITT